MATEGILSHVNLLQEAIRYDHLRVTIDSGVSYHLESGDISGAKLVGRTPIGCSTIVFLFNLFLAKYSDPSSKTPVPFSNILELARNGTNKTCDMHVYDIYGGSCADIGLSGDILASSFGLLKGPFSGHSEGAEDSPFSSKVQKVPKTEDFANSLIQMFLINLSQHAVLHAKLHGVNKLLFSGSLCKDQWAVQLLKLYMGFWTVGAMASYTCSDNMLLVTLGTVDAAESCPQ